MYQPTSTPSRACDEDLPLRATSILHYGADGSNEDKYGFYKMVEGSYHVWTIERGPLDSDEAMELKYQTLANRLRVKATNFGKYYGRTFKVRVVRVLSGKIVSISVERFD